MSSATLIETLEQCDFVTELYHPDGFGHIQVETHSPSDDGCPAVLLRQIDRDGLWDAMLEMVKTKPESWILKLAQSLPADGLFSTNCLLQFLDLLCARDTLIVLVQDSPQWFWNRHNLEMMVKVRQVVAALLEQTDCGMAEGLVDADLLGGVLERLDRRRADLCRG